VRIGSSPVLALVLARLNLLDLLIEIWLTANSREWVVRMGGGWNWLSVVFSGGLVKLGISSVDPAGYAVREYTVFSYTSLT
jgi:hypothetical protein